MKKIALLFCVLCMLLGCSRQKEFQFVDLVNPFIGTDAHGHTYPGKNNEFINSMLQRYREIGELPINEYGINETFCMIGHHAIPVIADALINGYGDFDQDLAYEAVRHSSTTDDFNFKADWGKYMRYGYLPSDSMVEAVSRTLEFNYNDWCVAMGVFSTSRD